MASSRWFIGWLILVGGCTPSPHDPVLGVTHSLAQSRAATIHDVRYDLRFVIPELPSEPVTGHLTLHFRTDTLEGPLVLDFRTSPDHLDSLWLDGHPVAYRTPEGHIVLPKEAVSPGAHTISAVFSAADDALNRNEDFLYALFVPDRASTAFPSFDQPDIKARYRLTLEIPTAWTALSNGPVVTVDTITTDRHLLTFAETAPISTYLFSFGAGRLSVETAERDGRTLTMYHRETDSAKVSHNRDAIFDLHATALAWLEEYTGIPYPFEKFAFFAIPSFQFGGMEHPGAVWYRAGSLFLDQSASQNQYLGRASVIAHETAHMWFGDLVTMEWFNDVWMKEVFANFMAAKIVEPSFPNIDHRLRFFLAHHPTAYGVDRTLGANPIRQPLDNLRDAGSLYGAIIYQKAPIGMRQLEQLVGEAAMRDGLREYLTAHRYGNATWSDLISVLDARTEEDLTSWSHAWVEEPWRPQLRVTRTGDQLTLSQDDPRPGRNLRWPQTVAVAIEVGEGGSVTTESLDLSETTDTVAITLAPGTTPGFVLPGADGLSYGRMVLDSVSRVRLLRRVGTLERPLTRAVGWAALWESVLAGELPPRSFLDALVGAIPTEPDQLIVQQLLGLVQTTFWRFLSPTQRNAVAPVLEQVLWEMLEEATGPQAKGAIFPVLVSITTTAEAITRLEQIWRTKTPPVGLTLSEPQYTTLAEALALRAGADADSILDQQAERLTNPDRIGRFAFVRGALSAEESVRDSLFESFRSVDQRRRERWVLDAMGYLNHPLRSPAAEKFLEPSLNLLPEIQETGDIFFPLRWMNATLDGHQSITAAETVVRFLDQHPDLPPRLTGKLLQAADELFRAALIVNRWDGGPTLESEMQPSSSGPGG